MISVRSHGARRAAVTVLLLLTSAAAYASDKVQGFVEAVRPDGLLVDSSVVSLASGGRLRGDVGRLSDARVGYWLEAKGRWQGRKGFVADSVEIRRQVPGASYAEKIQETSLKESEKLDKSDKIYANPEVNAYVSRVGMSLVPAWAAKEFKFSFHVLEDPSLNAFALPSGAIYVHTGLLAKLDNEAQLATVLGHEITHVTEQHGQRQYKSMMAWAIPAQIGAIVVGTQVNRRTNNPVYAVMAGLGLSMGLSAAVNGYGRKLEDQADRVGLRYMAEAGYDPREGPKVWDTFTAVYGDESKVENFFWGNHSTNEERQKNLKEEIRRHYRTSEVPEAASAEPDPTPVPAQPIVRTAEYQDTMLDLIRQNAREDFDLKRYDLSGKGFDRVLSRKPDDAPSWHYKGRIALATVQDPAAARAKALEDYQKAVTLDPNYPDVHRDLGLLYTDMGSRVEARKELGRYLELAPADAKDRKKVEKDLRKLD